MPPADPARLPPAAHLAVSFAHEGRIDRFVLAGVTSLDCGVLTPLSTACPGVPSSVAPAGWPASVLSPDEAAYHRRVPAEKRRREYLLGRYTAKSAVAAWLATAGAPSILSPGTAGFQPASDPQSADKNAGAPSIPSPGTAGFQPASGPQSADKNAGAPSILSPGSPAFSRPPVSDPPAGMPALPGGNAEFIPPVAIVIRPGAFQQPVVELPIPHSVGVTLAHSGGGAFALAHDVGHPCGLDFERHDPAHLAVLRSQVAPDELPPPGPGHETESMRHTLAWSIKEALSKALRCGLTCPFEILALDGLHLHPGGWCAGGFKNFGQYQFAAWPVGDHAFALVCAKHAQIAPVLPSLLDFTRKVLAAPAAAPGGPA